MAITNAQTSLIDMLIRLMPDWSGDLHLIKSKKPINHKAAKSLYSIWLNADNKSSQRVFKKPHGCTSEEIATMKSEELITTKGDEIEITSKGVNVIKTMLLGDERSSWEDDGTIIDYHKASSNIKSRVKTGQKTASGVYYLNQGKGYDLHVLEYAKRQGLDVNALQSALNSHQPGEIISVGNWEITIGKDNAGRPMAAQARKMAASNWYRTIK